MYENMTYPVLLAESKSYIGDGVQKGEGSLVFNALSALAYELEKLYVQANYILNQVYADSADLEHLEEIAANRSVFRREATAATVKIVGDAAIPIGSRFNLKAYNYTVTELISNPEHSYAAVCETAGAGPNELLGTLTPIDYISGLHTASITQILVPGSDEESKEDLYQRYLESFSTEAFAGNVTAYKQAVSAMNGVGGCKVYPVWDGPGTVKVVVIGADGRTPSEYLVNEISEALVPTEGTGYGLAPIDHTVTVAGVAEVDIDVHIGAVTKDSAYTRDAITASIEAAAIAYFKSIADEWQNGDENTRQTVFHARLETSILDVEGVVSVTNVMMNMSFHNIVLGSDQIPVFGELTIGSWTEA